MRNARHRIGEIGEAAFVLKATQLGLRLAKPLSGKEGYDYIADNGGHRHRVQVKTTSKRASKGSYHVTTARGARKNVPYKKGEIDFLVIYVHPEQTFYILSQKDLAGRVALSVPSTRRKHLGPFAQHHERWDLLLNKNPGPLNKNPGPLNKTPLPNKKSLLHKTPRRSKSLTIHASAENIGLCHSDQREESAIEQGLSSLGQDSLS